MNGNLKYKSKDVLVRNASLGGFSIAAKWMNYFEYEQNASWGSRVGERGWQVCLLFIL